MSIKVFSLFFNKIMGYYQKYKNYFKKIFLALCEIEDSFCFENDLVNIEKFSKETKVKVEVKLLSKSDWKIIFDNNDGISLKRLCINKISIEDRLTKESSIII